jgi:hypothetical protein
MTMHSDERLCWADEHIDLDLVQRSYCFFMSIEAAWAKLKLGSMTCRNWLV